MPLFPSLSFVATLEIMHGNRESEAPKTAPRNGQLASHRELVSIHYSGHQEDLLPGNHPVTGFPRELTRMYERQQSVQGQT